mmetsp:Transcript_10915/g.16287  ORF Transcript_10915/g.16287 Transcript_10915/m.16287 type:complete len:138 (+) Transcript_10915:482-895(+)
MMLFPPPWWQAPQLVSKMFAQSTALAMRVAASIPAPATPVVTAARRPTAGAAASWFPDIAVKQRAATRTTLRQALPMRMNFFIEVFGALICWYIFRTFDPEMWTKAYPTPLTDDILWRKRASVIQGTPGYCRVDQGK